jgi:phosphatidylglycerol:prolipoprotein diacylglycerol transferase
MNPDSYSVITFPSLGFEWDPARNFSVGPITIQFYGLIIAMGLLLAVIYGCKRAKQFGMSIDDLTDGVLCIVPFAIICARLYYCIFSWKDYADDPISILYIWKGGLAIYGGVIGAAIGIVVFSLVKKIKVGAVLDITSLGFLIGQSIGRWGNFFNREAFGAETDSFLRMGLTHKITGQITYYHPTFLYESVWNAAGFVLLHFLSKKRKFDGQIVLGYLAWYGLGRTFIEGLRMDSLYWGNFRVSQLLAACTCFIGVALLMVNAFRDHDPAKLQGNIYSAKLAQAEEAAQEESADTQE